MKNLDQIRAKNCIRAEIGGGADGGDSVAKKIPTMIMENGIIATAAFALEKGKGYEDVFNAIINHLADENIKLLPQKTGLIGFLVFLTGDKCNSSKLRLITAEAIEYLNYLRRLAK